MTGALFAATAALFAVGAALMLAAECARHASPGERRADWLKYGVYVGVIGALLGAGAWDRSAAAGLLAAIAVGGALELWRALRGRARHATLLATGALVVMLAALGHLLADARASVPAAPGSWIAAQAGAGNPGDVAASHVSHAASVWFPGYALAILLVAATDSFSQLWGRLLGRHKLCPWLSPGKTREGLAGGLATAMLVALLAGFLAPGVPFVSRAALGLATALAATAGDLLFSWIKRRLGIKDFSSAVPGHGGILDRFDSLVVAAPVYYWCRALLPG